MIIKTADSRQQTADSRQQTADSRQQTADSRQQTADSRQQTADSRCHYFDFLRVIGAFAVIVIHVSCQAWYKADVSSLEWQWANFWDSIARWAVPVFTMISGALFLSRDIPVGKIYGKYVFRMFTAFTFWAFVYAATFYAAKRDIAGALRYFIPNGSHMYFTAVIAGLYAFQPILKRIAESEFLPGYFLALCLVFTFIIPEAIDLITLVSEKLAGVIRSYADSFRLDLSAEFSGYFMLGYVLSRIEITPKLERIIYSAGITGFASTILLSSAASLKLNEPSSVFYSYYSVNVLCEAIAMFVFFRTKFNRHSRIIRTLSEYSFGAYLVHALVISALKRVGLHANLFASSVSIPVVSLMVFAVSFAISAAIKKIPVLNKYVV